MRSGLRAGAGKREKAGAGGGAACGSRPALGRLPSGLVQAVQAPKKKRGRKGAAGLPVGLRGKERKIGDWANSWCWAKMEEDEFFKIKSFSKSISSIFSFTSNSNVI